MDTMKAKLLVILCIVFFSTCYCVVQEKSSTPGRAASASLIDVKKAISNASAGSVVIVPNGTARWTDQLVITKGITLKAETKGGVTITSGYLSRGTTNASFLIRYRITDPEDDEQFRLSGFNIDLAGMCGGILIENNSVTASRRNRLDNNEIKNAYGRMIKINGTVYGVCDNNTLYLSNGSLLTAYGLNESSWNNLTFENGSGDNWYYEDNTIYIYGTAHDGGAGGRYASRHNTYINRKNGNIYPIMDLHGNMGAGGNLAGMGVEVYGNTYDMDGNNCDLLDLRGGRCVFYNNSVTNSGGSAILQIREEVQDSLNPPAKAQDGQPQHVSGAYFWDNYMNGRKITENNPSLGGTLAYTGEGVVPRENVHFWREDTSFSGGTGIGVGLKVDRPANCVPGVGYWATDEQKLYRCSSTNVWALYYEPFTYPHPLRQSLND